MTTPTIEKLRTDIDSARSELVRREASQESAAAELATLEAEVQEMSLDPATLVEEAQRIREDVATAVGVVGNCSDTCGTVFVTALAASALTQLTVTFAKRFPTQFVNIQITAADRFGASCTDVWSGSVSVGTQATGFTLNFVSGAGTAGQDCIFHYFVMDVVAPATQIG